MKHFSILFILFFVSCAKPEQPPLSKKEKRFLDKLSKEMNCKVRRSVDVMLLGSFVRNHNTGSYSLELTLDCKDLSTGNKNRDSMSTRATALAKELYNGPLLRDKMFDEIGITFTCDTNNSLYQVMIFDYKTDSLYPK